MTRQTASVWAGGLVLLLVTSMATAQVTRTVLQQKDTSIAGREVITAKAEFAAGAAAGPHTHPGDEISYVAQGAIEVLIGGKSTTYKTGEAFMVPAGMVHDAKAVGGPAVVIVNYLIEKGKPATTPVGK
jgi:quercetin dioxygenase-like cupin family protein